jgi:hypothetical protein
MLGRQVDAIVYATMSHRVVTPPAALRDIGQSSRRAYRGCIAPVGRSG